MLLPAITDENLAFWEGTRKGVLRVQRCQDTQRLIFPPRARSPWGARRVPEWTDVSGRGKIWSFVVPHPPLLPEFDKYAPYNVVLIELEEDSKLRLVGNLVTSAGAKINSGDPGSIQIGAEVRVVFERINEDITLPRWVLSGPEFD